MKRIYPERSYGKYICCDGTNHEWFMPIVKTFIHSIKVFFCSNYAKINLADVMQRPTFPQRSDKPVITWLGHSTFLIQVAGKNILTDPIFGSLSFIFRRLIPLVIRIDDLPSIDYVLISHNHFDHMDSQSLLQLKHKFPQMKVLVPMGDKEWFDRHLFAKVSEHMWWESIYDDEDSNIKFTFLPANHWSQRTLFDKNRSLWGSWMLQAHNFTLYFAGDTSWGAHFEQIGDEFKNIDVALLPVAPGEPRELMKSSHINAREAVQAFIKLKAKTFIPMHWGTYHLGFDDFYAPIELLKQSWHDFREQLVGKQLKVMKFGELISDFGLKIAWIMQQAIRELSL
jgi:L-ascorbate metabolism protein UlaG (beta-lactamase superfamily)